MQPVGQPPDPQTGSAPRGQPQPSSSTRLRPIWHPRSSCRAMLHLLLYLSSSFLFLPIPTPTQLTPSLPAAFRYAIKEAGAECSAVQCRAGVGICARQPAQGGRALLAARQADITCIIEALMA